MSKLSELLRTIVNKVNSAVKTEPQTLTEEQKAQVRENLGIDDSTSYPAIIDVIELPTESIQEDVFYRLLRGSLVNNGFILKSYTCYCVDGLPGTGEPFSNVDQTQGNIYFNTQDYELYGYIDDILSMGLGVPAGWYAIAMILGSLGYEYKGIITDITEDQNDDAFRLLLERVVYQYKDRWTTIKSIGFHGSGASSEIFNHLSNEASGDCSHAEGWNTTASGNYSHAEGYNTTASGNYSHAEGESTIASGSDSHAEGNGTTASSNNSHAEGNGTTASGGCSHAEGFDTTASGYVSHAEGIRTTASGSESHAEGSRTTASGHQSHAEGNETTASGSFSHAEGDNTTASRRSQHVQGEYNIKDPANDPHSRGKYAHIVGNGTSDDNRSNAHTLDWDGNAWYAGYVEGTALILKSPNGTRFRITVDDSGTLSATKET